MIPPQVEVLAEKKLLQETSRAFFSTSLAWFLGCIQNDVQKRGQIQSSLTIQVQVQIFKTGHFVS